MHSVVNRKEMMEALRKVALGLSKGVRSEVDGFDSVRFEDGMMWASNQFVSVGVPSPIKEFNCSVKGAKLLEILNRTSGETIEFTFNDFELSWKSGRAKGVFQCVVGNQIRMPSDEFADCPPDLLDALLFCKVNGNFGKKIPVFVDRKRAYSISSQQVSVFNLSGEFNGTMYLEIEAINLIKRIGRPVGSYIDGNFVHFKMDNGSFLKLTMVDSGDFRKSGAVDLVTRAQLKPGDSVFTMTNDFTEAIALLDNFDMKGKFIPAKMSGYDGYVKISKAHCGDDVCYEVPIAGDVFSDKISFDTKWVVGLSFNEDALVYITEVAMGMKILVLKDAQKMRAVASVREGM